MRRAAPWPRMDLTSNIFSSPHRQMTERNLDSLQRQRYNHYDDYQRIELSTQLTSHGHEQTGTV